MSQAKAECTCKICGGYFIKTKTCRNTKEAASWEEWAKGIFDLCPACYKKKAEEEVARQPLKLKIRLEPFNMEYPVVLAFDGNTKPAKDQIKSLHYSWREDTSGVFGLLAMRPPFYWQRNCSVEDLDKEIAAVEEAFPEVVICNEIKDVDMISYRKLKQQYDEEQQKKQAEKEALQEKISKIPKPERPECLPAGYWNGRIYGSEKNGYNIYIDKVKHDISPEERAEILQYEESMEEYQAQVKSLKELS